MNILEALLTAWLISGMMLAVVQYARNERLYQIEDKGHRKLLVFIAAPLWFVLGWVSALIWATGATCKGIAKTLKGEIPEEKQS